MGVIAGSGSFRSAMNASTFCLGGRRMIKSSPSLTLEAAAMGWLEAEDGLEPCFRAEGGLGDGGGFAAIFGPEVGVAVRLDDTA